MGNVWHALRFATLCRYVWQATAGCVGRYCPSVPWDALGLILSALQRVGDLGLGQAMAGAQIGIQRVTGALEHPC